MKLQFQDALRLRVAATLSDMDTNKRARVAVQAWAKESDWADAFASGDPARQWAASCSLARVVTSGDAWLNSTAMHEAAVAALDAVMGHGTVDAVTMAVLVARRAVRWEQLARVRLVPAGLAQGRPVAF